jgi:uncharacterized protein (DUF1800 family)
MKIILFFLLFTSYSLFAQPDTVIIGFGSMNSGSAVSASSNGNKAINTINQDGYLPNLNAASRFLSQATLGYNYQNIEFVSNMGIEDWIDNEYTKPIPFKLQDKVKTYHDYVKTQTNDPLAFSNSNFWNYAWWQYHMTSEDMLRQRIAFALSEILVISDKSTIGGNPYALASYYDMLLSNSFTNYRTILDKVTYHPCMGVYLTYTNNPKSNPANNQFPDENYAREIMQLFTIGTVKLNMDGTVVKDVNNNPIATYDNEDISQFAMVFTGLSWGDRTIFNRGPLNDTSYTLPLIQFNGSHEPGAKTLLNNFIVTNRNPVDGNADITDALNNLFNHSNTPPFISKLLIQRLITSNPSPAYVNRVANIFVNNGAGIRGDMKAIIKAILLDPEAKSCDTGEQPTQGALREPFIRYVQMNKAFNVSTTSGNFRNSMSTINQAVQQKPLSSPSVFNFFQQDYQPIGVIEQANLVAPEFQITNTQTIMNYVNAVYRFIITENIADEASIYTNEPASAYANEISNINIDNEVLLTNNDQLNILLDRLNLLLAGGRLSKSSISIIRNVLMEWPNSTATERKDKAKLAIYMVLTAPEYLIKR